MLTALGYSPSPSSEASNLLSDTHSPVNQRKSSKWTSEEDNLLRTYVSIYDGRQWRKISEHIPGRNFIQCLHRWTKILRPGLIKGPWTPREDERLIAWVNKYGPNKWAQAAKLITGRSGKQCRERWFNGLSPDINKGEWTKEEDELIFELYRSYGSSWSKIAKLVPGRTENAIKNRFYATFRKLDQQVKLKPCLSDSPQQQQQHQQQHHQQKSQGENPKQEPYTLYNLLQKTLNNQEKDLEHNNGTTEVCMFEKPKTQKVFEDEKHLSGLKQVRKETRETQGIGNTSNGIQKKWKNSSRELCGRSCVDLTSKEGTVISRVETCDLSNTVTINHGSNNANSLRSWEEVSLLQLPSQGKISEFEINTGSLGSFRGLRVPELKLQAHLTLPKLHHPLNLKYNREKASLSHPIMVNKSDFFLSPEIANGLMDKEEWKLKERERPDLGGKVESRLFDKLTSLERLLINVKSELERIEAPDTVTSIKNNTDFTSKLVQLRNRLKEIDMIESLKGKVLTEAGAATTYATPFGVGPDYSDLVIKKIKIV